MKESSFMQALQIFMSSSNKKDNSVIHKSGNSFRISVCVLDQDIHIKGFTCFMNCIDSRYLLQIEFRYNITNITPNKNLHECSLRVLLFTL